MLAFTQEQVCFWSVNDVIYFHDHHSLAMITADLIVILFSNYSAPHQAKLIEFLAIKPEISD